MVRPGWFKRQSDSVAEEVKKWPLWMKEAAGLEEEPVPEKSIRCSDSRKCPLPPLIVDE